MDGHLPIDEFSQAYSRSIDDVHEGQYIEVDEDVKGIVEGDEYESLEYLLGRFLIMTSCV